MSDGTGPYDAEVFDAYLNYLDDLRESGQINMLGAAPYLQDAFPELSRDQARGIHTRWMQTFGERHRQPKGAR